MKKGIFIFLIFILLAIPSLWAEDDFQYWSRFSLKVVDTRYVDFTTYGELRLLDNASDLKLWLASQRLQIDPVKNLSLGMNYTFLQNEVANFQYHHRLELEFNPYWQGGDRLKLFNRNRIEFRWIEDRGSDNGRFRHLWEMSFSPKIKRLSFIKDFYVNNEFFVDFNKEEINENRVTPFGTTFKIHHKAAFKVFYMIQSRKRVQDWSSNQILGTQLSLSV